MNAALQVAMTKLGWFDIPGVRKGERSLDEQQQGLELALRTCANKDVLDIGCAEGCISILFAGAGARSVVGIEPDPLHVPLCRHMFATYPTQLQHVEAMFPDFAWPTQFDIVLALAVLHKLKDPEVGIDRACELCRDLLIIRGPDWMNPTTLILGSKHSPRRVAMKVAMERNGFRLDQHFTTHRLESVLYWRRYGLG